MDKKHFLKELGMALYQLPKAERDRAIAYYREMIDERIESGLSEEAAIASMDSIEKIASEITSEAEGRGVSLQKRSPGKSILVVLIGLLISAMLIAGLVAAFSLLFDINGCTDGGEWVQQTRVYEADEFTDLIVDVSSYKVFIGTSDDGKAHLEYYENDRVKFDVQIMGGTLKIKQKVRSLFFFGISTNDKQLQLMLPESFNGNIEADCTSGEVRMDHISTAGSVKAGMTSGQTVIYDLTASSLYVDYTSGKVVMGRVEIAGDLSIDGTSGNVSVEGAACARLISNVTSGRTEFKRVRAGSSKFDATSGTIVLESLDSDDIYIDVTSGSISGSLVGSIEDYTIESHVTSGKNSLPGNYGKGARKLYAELTSGNINLSFEN